MKNLLKANARFQRRSISFIAEEGSSTIYVVKNDGSYVSEFDCFNLSDGTYTKKNFKKQVKECLDYYKEAFTKETFQEQLMACAEHQTVQSYHRDVMGTKEYNLLRFTV